MSRKKNGELIAKRRERRRIDETLSTYPFALSCCSRAIFFFFFFFLVINVSTADINKILIRLFVLLCSAIDKDKYFGLRFISFIFPILWLI